MPPIHPLILLIFLATCFGCGLLGLAGLRTWLRAHKGTSELDERTRQAIAEDVYARVTDALCDQNERIEELHERVDFAERLLTRGEPERRNLEVSDRNSPTPV